MRLHVAARSYCSGLLRGYWLIMLLIAIASHSCLLQLLVATAGCARAVAMYNVEEEEEEKR